METPIFYTLLVATVICHSFCSAKRDDLFDYKIEELGETVKMWCNDSIQFEVVPNYTSPVSWMLPNLTILEQSVDRYVIADSFWSLTVHNVTVEDLGQYHCMMRVYNESDFPIDWYLAILGLNAQGPYFEDLWDKYELNTIIGLSSGFGFLALAICTMLVYHFRYISLDEDDDTKSNTGTPEAYSAFGASTKSNDKESNGTGMVNKAYDGDASLHADSEPSMSDNTDPTEQDDVGTAF